MGPRVRGDDKKNKERVRFCRARLLTQDFVPFSVDIAMLVLPAAEAPASCPIPNGRTI
jgi:hypothetical protein